MNFEVRDHVFDLGALVKAESSHNVVLELVAAHCLFHQARLRVGAVQNRSPRRLPAFASRLPKILGNVIRRKQGFILAVRSFVVSDLRPAAAVGPQVLSLASDVVGYHDRSRLQNVLGGAIVLLQANDARFGKVLLELQDVANVGAAPGVDALVFVADGADIVLAAGEHAHQFILRAVGVLVFVHLE